MTEKLSTKQNQLLQQRSKNLELKKTMTFKLQQLKQQNKVLMNKVFELQDLLYQIGQQLKKQKDEKQEIRQGAIKAIMEKENMICELQQKIQKNKYGYIEENKRDNQIQTFQYFQLKQKYDEVLQKYQIEVKNFQDIICQKNKDIQKLNQRIQADQKQYQFQLTKLQSQSSDRLQQSVIQTLNSAKLNQNNLLNNIQSLQLKYQTQITQIQRINQRYKVQNQNNRQKFKKQIIQLTNKNQQQLLNIRNQMQQNRLQMRRKNRQLEEQIKKKQKQISELKNHIQKIQKNLQNLKINNVLLQINKKKIDVQSKKLNEQIKNPQISCVNVEKQQKNISRKSSDQIQVIPTQISNTTTISRLTDEFQEISQEQSQKNKINLQIWEQKYNLNQQQGKLNILNKYNHQEIQNLKKQIKEYESNIQNLNNQLIIITKQLHQSRNTIIQLTNKCQRTKKQSQLFIQLQQIKSHLYKVQTNFITQKLKYAQQLDYIKQQFGFQRKIFNQKIIKLGQQKQSLQLQLDKYRTKSHSIFGSTNFLGTPHKSNKKN